MNNQGILLVDKAPGSTSFHIVAQLRRLLKIDKIGHAGTLDPFATGVMVMLVGRDFTRRSDEFLSCDKEYRATLHLGITTNSFDIDGQVTSRNDHVPSRQEVLSAISAFQGKISQIPPMFSAKKIGGKKLYDLARQGIEIERQPIVVEVKTTLIRYEYPEIEIEVVCTKGTYIRTIAYDIGHMLGCGAHLSTLVRLRSGSYRVEECVSQEMLKNPEFDVRPFLRVV
jgi:tRNA pseudouridine55 synthase